MDEIRAPKIPLRSFDTNWSLHETSMRPIESMIGHTTRVPWSKNTITIPTALEQEDHSLEDLVTRLTCERLLRKSRKRYHQLNALRKGGNAMGGNGSSGGSTTRLRPNLPQQPLQSVSKAAWRHYLSFSRQLRTPPVQPLGVQQTHQLYCRGWRRWHTGIGWYWRVGFGE